MMMGTALSPKDPTKPKMMAAKIPGNDKGITIRRKVVNGLAPNKALASMYWLSIAAIDKTSGKIMKGI
jgi:hypothetical protein